MWVSIGFFKQTEEGEFILRVDEHIITGGEDNIIEYRELQNLLLRKSFKTYPDVFDKLKVLTYTKEIPNDTVSVRKELSENLKVKIREGLKAISHSPEGSKVLKKLYGISGFTDLDGLFDPVREARRLLNLSLGEK